MSPALTIRITNVYQNNFKFVKFSGVVIKSIHKIACARSIAYVTTRQEDISIDPANGQQWLVTGDYSVKEVEYGDYTMYAVEFDHPKLEVTLPNTNEAFIRFIAEQKDFKGIGEVKARELWSELGAQIFAICEKKDLSALTPYLSKKSSDSLFKGFEKYANLKYATWLTDKEIPLYIQKRLFKIHGEESIELIKANPYNLVTFGMNFKAVDTLTYKHFTTTPDEPNRLTAAIEMVLKEHGSNGHTKANINDIKPRLFKLLNNIELVNKALEQGSKTLSFIKKDKTYHLANAYIMENVVAKRFNTLNMGTDNWDIQFEHSYNEAVSQLPYDLTEEQIEAIKISLTHQISCITGGAGTGKTTVLRTVLRTYNELGNTIIPVTLSGRAAMRLHESIGFITSTIARLLRESPIEQETKSILVIDEASMIDIATMYRLVTHLHPSVRMLFVGDPNQLPPIGAGIVLADMIKSKKIPVSELSIVKRQDEKSGIPLYSKAINDGHIPENLSVGNIQFHDVSNLNIAQYCVNLMQTIEGDCKIMAPTKVLVKEINQLGQQTLNPVGKLMEVEDFGIIYKTDFRLGDPVIFTANNYNAGVQNGSLGRLISVERENDIWGVVKLDDGHEIELDKALFDSLEQAYAITLHKAQGSQFKTVIVALSYSQLIDRAWLYTAVTRSEINLHIVGLKNTFKRAINTQSARYIRKTALADLIR